MALLSSPLSCRGTGHGCPWQCAGWDPKRDRGAARSLPGFHATSTGAGRGPHGHKVQRRPVLLPPQTSATLTSQAPGFTFLIRVQLRKCCPTKCPPPFPEAWRRRIHPSQDLQRYRAGNGRQASRARAGRPHSYLLNMLRTVSIGIRVTELLFRSSLDGPSFGNQVSNLLPPLRAFRSQRTSIPIPHPSPITHLRRHGSQLQR
jgi:hypothetical protein